MGMRLFELHREVDASGVSGTGRVAEGVEYSNGMCSLTWLTPFRCVNIYESMKTLEAVHGHGGATKVVWLPVQEKNELYK